MNNMSTFFTTLLLLLPVLGLQAQQRLTLRECRDLAIENNKKLKIADQEVLAGKAQKEEAFTHYLPALDATGVYLRNQKEVNLLENDAFLPVGYLKEDGNWSLRPDQVMIDPATGQPVLVNGQPVPKDYALLPKDAMTVDSRNTALIRIGLTQPVYLGGKIRAYHRLAGLSEQLSRSKRDLEIQNVIQATDEAYWQVVSLAGRKAVAEKYVEALKKFEHNMEIMYTTGVAVKSDVLSVRVKLNEGEMMLLKVTDGLSLARMLLNQTCGLPLHEEYRLEEEESDLSLSGPVEKRSLEQVYGLRPEITGLELATQIYRKKEKISLADYLPSVALTANYLTTSPSFFNGISTKFDGMWSVGIGVQAPIFHWGASRKSLRQARVQTEIMEYRLQEAKEQIELQVSQSEFKVREVAKKAEMAGNNLLRAEENLKLADWGFREGTIPVANVLEAQTAWLSACSDLIDARIEAKLCEVYLKKAYGVLGAEYTDRELR